MGQQGEPFAPFQDVSLVAWLFCFRVFVVLGIKPRTSLMADKYSTIGPHPHPSTRPLKYRFWFCRAFFKFFEVYVSDKKKKCV